MQTFDQHLLALHNAGRISLEDAIRYANNADELELKLSGLTEDD